MKLIPEHFLDLYCKIGQGEKSCIYGTVSAVGFECAADSDLKILLEKRADNKEMKAQSRGIGCPYKINNVQSR